MTFERREQLIRQEEREEGREEEREALLIALCKDGEIKIESAARRLNISVEEFTELLKR